MKAHVTLPWIIVLGLLVSTLSANGSDTLYSVVQTGSFAPISGTGTPVILEDDELSTALPIGFSFGFFENTYTHFYISSNGFLTFDPLAGDGCCSGQQIPDAFDPNDLIAFAWEDLDPGLGGSIQYFTTGTAPNRILVVDFINIEHISDPDTVTAQVQLHESSNRIEIHTTRMDNSYQSTHTMGIENSDGSLAYVVPGRNASGWTASQDFVAFVQGGLRADHDAGISAFDMGPEICAGPQSVQVSLQNYGLQPLDSVYIAWELNGQSQPRVFWQGQLDTLGGVGSSLASLSLGQATFQLGQLYELKAWTESPNGQPDTLNANDTAQLSFSPRLAGGTYTIGGSQPDYGSIQAALNDLQAYGICGPITFAIRSGTYAEQVDVYPITGASASHPVIFESESGDSSAVIIQYSGTSSRNFTLRFAGADHVTFRNLTLQALNNSYGRVVEFKNGACNNELSHCRLIGVNASFASDFQALIYSPAAFVPDSANHFLNNRLEQGSMAIRWAGVQLYNKEKGNRAVGNEIVGPYGLGMFWEYQEGLELSKNLLHKTGAPSGFKGIRLEGSEGVFIAKNQIFLDGGDGLYLNRLQSQGGQKNRIWNNFVGISGSQQSQGLYLLQGEETEVFHNSIAISNSHSQSSALFQSFGGGSQRYHNNVLVNTGGGWAIRFSDMSSVDSCDFQDLYATGSYLARLGSNDYASLAAWQAASGQDLNSLSVDPQFVSATDLHASRAALAGAGLSGLVPDDIDEELRKSPPDLGADEFSVALVNDVGLVSLELPTAPFAPGTYPLRLVLQNNGGQVLNSLSLAWTINGQVQPGYTWTGSLAAGQRDTLVLGNWSVQPLEGISLEVISSNPNGAADAFPADDTLRQQNLRPALSGTYTIGGSQADFQDPSQAITWLNLAGILDTVGFAIRPGTYPGQVQIEAFPGQSCQKPVIFYAENQDSSSVIMSYQATGSADNYVVKVNGAVGIWLSRLSIQALGTSHSRALVWEAGLSCNRIEHSQLLAPMLRGTSQEQALLFASATGFQHQNSILNNRFLGGSYAISAQGNPQRADSAWRVKGNHIEGAYFRAMAFQNHKDLTIEQNQISSTDFFASGSGIYLRQCQAAIELSSNQIRLPSGYGIYLQDAGSPLGPNSRIWNHVISIRGSIETVGLNLQACQNWQIWNNSLQVYGQAPSQSKALALGTQNQGISLLNNILYNAGGYAGYFDDPSALDSSDYNAWYGEGDMLMYDGQNLPDLGAWQSRQGLDLHSLEVNPYFRSAEDFVPRQPQLDSAALPLAGLNLDYQGESRDLQYPDIGADEFVPLDRDVGVTALIRPISDCALPDSGVEVEIEITNFGKLSQGNIPLAYSVNAQAPVAENLSQLVLPGRSIRYTFQQGADLLQPGDFFFDLYTALPNDQDPQRDSLTVQVSRPPAFIWSLRPDTTLCEGDTLFLWANGGSRYRWGHGVEGNHLPVSPDSSRWYPVEAENLNGCIRTDSVWVEVRPVPAQPQILPLAGTHLCEGDTLSLKSSVQERITWNTGETDTLIRVSEAQTLRLRQYDADGICFTEAPPLLITATHDSIQVEGFATLCPGDSVSLKATGGGSFLWSTGASSDSIRISPSATTLVGVQASSPQGCNWSDTVEIQIVPAQPPDAAQLSLPQDGSFDLAPRQRLSWRPSPQASSYDLYLWKQGENRPLTPEREGQRSLYATLELDHGASYLWQVKASNSCFSSWSDTASFQIRALPDLALDTLIFADPFTSGQYTTLSWTVRNLGGPTGSQSWYDYLWLSTDEDLRSADDWRLGKIPNPIFLNPGDSYTQTATVFIPREIQGKVYLFVVADNVDAYCPGGVCTPGLKRKTHNPGMAESDEQNNHGQATVDVLPGPEPDLVAASLASPSAAFGGDTLLFTYRVENRSSQAAYGPWSDRIYLSEDSLFDLTDWSFRARNFRKDSSLLPGQSYVEQAELILPVSLVGDYHVFLATDTEHDLFEGFREANNRVEASNLLQVSLRPPADLQVLAVNPPLTAQSGSLQSLRWTVGNQGASAPEKGTWVDAYFISRLDTFNLDSAIALGRKYHSGGRLLLPGNSYQAQRQIRIPQGLSGNYYFYVWTDSRDAIFEYTYESNNIRRSPQAVNISLAPYPDLQVSQVEVNFDTLAHDSSRQISWVVRNAGSGVARGKWQDRVLLSRDSSLNAAVTYGNFTYNSILNPNDSLRRTLTLSPQGLTGRWWIHVVTDVRNEIFEYQAEGNNQAYSAGLSGQGVLFLPDSSPPPLPWQGDLAISVLAAPDTLQSGGKFSFSYTTRNAGPDAIPSLLDWEESLSLSQDSLPDAQDIPLIDLSSQRGYPAGSSINRSAFAELPSGLTAGTYFLLMELDPLEALAGDTTHANNWQGRRVYVQASPHIDLEVSAWQVPDSLIAGQSYSLTYEVSNTGPEALSPDLSWYDRVYLSAVPEWTRRAKALGGKRQSRQLAAGSHYRDSLAFNIPSFVSGYRYLVLRTDSRNDCYEADGETNNDSAGLSLILGPGAANGDLAYSSLTVPDTLWLGDSLAISYQLKNVGPGSILGTADDALYASLNPVFPDSADELLAFPGHEINLATGDSVALLWKGRINPVMPGSYYLGLFGNSRNQLGELSQANNRVLSPQQVYLGARSLALSVKDSFDLIQGGERFYAVQVAAGLDLKVSLLSNASWGGNEIWIAYGRLPSEQDYDAKAQVAGVASPVALLPETQSGTYYLRVRSQVMLPQAVSILAEALPFSLLDHSPGSLGQGKVTAEVYGAGFRPGMQLELRDSLGQAVAQAQVVEARSSMEWIIRWELDSVALGRYDLYAISPNLSQVKLVEKIEVQPAFDDQIAAIPLLPSRLKYKKPAFFTLAFENTGNVDIEVARAEVILPDHTRILSVEVSPGARSLSSMLDSAYIPATDWLDKGPHLYLPILKKNLRPGERFWVKLKLENFLYDEYPVLARAVASSLEGFIGDQVYWVKYLRQYVLQYPDSFPPQTGMVDLAEDPNAWLSNMMSAYIEQGLFSANEFASYAQSTCSTCQGDYTYSPGVSPGLLTSGDMLWGPGESYLWEITHPEGTAAQALGWDLIHAQGRIDVTADSLIPFELIISSLSSYDLQPDFLSSWSPGYDHRWPIAVADSGIHGLDAADVVIDDSQFALENDLYGGHFELELSGGGDTLYLWFRTRIPDPGEDGYPGGPGQPGMEGGQGGPGGAGASNLPPGEGGAGGTGGFGIPGDYAPADSLPPGNGGQGGQGGAAGNGQTGGTGGTGGVGGQGGPGQNGGTGGTGGVGGHGGSNGSPGNGGRGGKGGNGENGGTPGLGGPPGDGGGLGSPPGDGGDPGDSGDDDENWDEEDPPDDDYYIPPKPKRPRNCTGPTPQEASNIKKACELLNQGAGCVLTAIGCGEDLAKYSLIGAVAGAGAGAAVGAGYAGLKCGIGIFNCLSGGNSVSNAIGCATGVVDAFLGDPGAAILGCQGYLCETVPLLRSCDPNEIKGPLGIGPEQWVSINDTLSYRIYFENDSLLASAPAQRVSIRQPLDDHANPLSFRLGDFGFGPFSFQVPGQRAAYNTVLDLQDSLGVKVELTAGVDLLKRELFWVFQTIDPQSGLPPFDPLRGFLAINDAFSNGEGYVSYTIVPDAQTQSGDSIQAQAEIIFDINDPIVTNTHINVVDALPPVSRIDSLAPLGRDSLIHIFSSAEDDVNGSGVAQYRIQVSVDGAPYYPLAERIPIDSSYQFYGEKGRDYCFFTQAADWTGNQEAEKLQSDTCLRVPSPRLTLLSQVKDSSFCEGEIIDIHWRSQDVDSLHLYLTADSGQSYFLFASDLPAEDSLFQMTVPTAGASGIGNGIKLVSASDTSVVAVSNGFFRIQPLPARPMLGLGAQTICEGDSLMLQGPAGFAAYYWSDGSTGDSIWVSQSGSFSLVVEDNFGCQSPASDSLLLTARALPLAPAISGDTLFCQGDSSLLQGPAGFAAYYWSDGSTGDSIWVSQSGSFSLIVEDNFGCQSPASDSLLLTARALPLAPAISGDTLFCQGDSSLLQGPAGFAAYYWSDGSTGDSIWVSQSGSFSLVVEDNFGCQSPASDSLLLTARALPLAPAISGDTLFCQGDSSLLQGPAGFAAYYWSDGSTGDSIWVSQSGSFSLVVEDNFGCQSPASDSLLLTARALPLAPAISGDTLFCQGDSSLLQGPAGFAAYYWSDGSTGDSIWVSQSGSFSLVVEDNFGCQSPASDSVQLTARALPMAPVITGDTLFCQDDSSLLQGPAGFAAYYWSDGSTGDSIWVSQSGSFSLVVEDNFGCQSPASGSLLLTARALPLAPAISGDTLFCQGDSSLLQGPAGFAAYYWSDGSTGDSIWVSQSGSFSLVVEDNFGCQSPASDSLTVNGLAIPNTPAIQKIGLDSLRSSVAANRYEWFLDGTLLPDSLQQIHAQLNGHYSLRVFNGPCGSAISDSILVNVGLVRDLEKHHFQIFPNPNEGLFWVKAQFQQATLVQAEVYDLQGRKVWQALWHAEQGHLSELVNLRTQPEGVYLLWIRVNRSYLIQRIQVLR
jgi:hypothetical protein